MIKHKKSGIVIVLLLMLALSGMATTSAAAPEGPDAPVGTTFTYQGRLIDGGIAANGAYDLRFKLFDAATGRASGCYGAISGCARERRLLHRGIELR